MLLSENKPPIRLLSILALGLILQACATAPSVPSTCPQFPALDARVPLGQSFQDRTQSFLSGKLPEPTKSGQGLRPVTR